MTDLTNWRLEFAADAPGESTGESTVAPALTTTAAPAAPGICRLILDVPGKSQNVLSAAVIEELDAALDAIEAAAPAAVFIASAKVRGFIAGADVSEFARIESAEDALEAVAAAHAVFDRLQALRAPTVALINGHCLGGGLELALACDYRVACDSAAIRIGLPEVKLGIHPGFGGVARLIETSGVLPAMRAMLSGRGMDPAAAKRLGVVDFAVPPRQLERTARHLIDAKIPPRARRIPLRQKILNRALLPALSREVVARILRKQVAARANPRHYPAPYRLIELWRKHGGSRADLLAAERESVAQLITTPTARNLTRLFFLREKLARGHGGGDGDRDGDRDGDHGRDGDGDRDNPGDTGDRDRSAEKFTHVHVIGGGVMGGDIGAWCALRGLTVTVSDRDLEAIGRATARAHKLFRRKLKSPRLTRLAQDRFRADPAGHGARRADVIIEAVAEDADAKIAVFAELQKTARPDALLATNTSSIPLETLGAALSLDEGPGEGFGGGGDSGGGGDGDGVRDSSHSHSDGDDSTAQLLAPNRLVGLHFFNPVAKMQLVEVVTAATTRPDAVARAVAFARRIGRLPVTVKSGPGFLVNRILTPYLLEAVALLDEGVAAARIDRAATDFGMLMGPVTLADTVGLDICLRVAQNLVGNGGGADGGVPELLRRQVEAGRLGKKTGRGFYQWTNGRAQKDASHGKAPAEARDRLILRCLNEAVACLREGVVESADDLDAALVFGAGFAPHRGGPMRYIATRGCDTLRARLNELQARHGARFAPHPGWDSLG